MDPWFEDATPAEVADFAGLPTSKVRRVLFAWVKSSKVRRIHSHATAIAEQIGWAGTPEGLVHTALELFMQRAQKRERVPSVNIDEEIQHFLALHRTASDDPMPPRHAPTTALPPDTDPGN
jgi:hypothetical protein